MKIDPLAAVSDIGAALPNAVPFPIDRVPTWMLVNVDSPLELPLMGQFQPDVKRSFGDPIWVKRPGILGGKPWLRYVGRGNETLKFTFHGISNTIIDLYPSAAWERLKELSSIDATLGRPPKVCFIHGLEIVQGYITSLPEAAIDYWPLTRLPREIGPIEVEITIYDVEPVSLALSTNYVVITDGTTYEALAKAQYAEPRYAPSLAEYNQGKVVGDTAEIPRKSNSAISKTVKICPYMVLDEDITGL